MNAFTFYNPVKIYFGKDAIENVRHALSAFGPNVLLAYGGGSIKRNGLYERVVTILKECGKNITELSGIMANPRTTKVEEGVSLVKETHTALILAVGGGSVIDCSKAIATVSCMEDMTDYWERLFVKKEKTNRAVPLATIVTLPATGSEMNTDCVITNWEEQLKYSIPVFINIPAFPFWILNIPLPCQENRLFMALLIFYRTSMKSISRCRMKIMSVMMLR